MRIKIKRCGALRYIIYLNLIYNIIPLKVVLTNFLLEILFCSEKKMRKYIGNHYSEIRSLCLVGNERSLVGEAFQENSKRIC